MSNAIATASTTPKSETALAEIPKAFLTGHTETGADKAGLGSIPYVGYYGAKALPDTRTACEEAGVKVGQFYLNDVAPIKVDPFGVHWLTVGTLYTKRDNRMNVVACRTTNTDDEFKLGFREHLFALVAVRIPGPTGTSFFPALVQLYGGLAACFNKSRGFLASASDPASWAVRGAPYAASAKAVIPGGRFYAKISATQEETPSGNDFNLGASVVQPTPEADVVRFNAWYNQNLKVLVALAKINDERIADAKSKPRDIPAATGAKK